MVHTKEEIERARYIVEFMRHAVVIGNDDYLDEVVDTLNDGLRLGEPSTMRFIKCAARVPRDFIFGVFGVKEGMKTLYVDDPTLDIEKIRSEWYERHNLDKLPFPYDEAKKAWHFEEERKPDKSVKVSATDVCRDERKPDETVMIPVTDAYRELIRSMNAFRKIHNVDEHTQLIGIAVGSKPIMDSIGAKTDPLGASKSVTTEARIDENGDFLVFLSVDGHKDAIDHFVYRLK